MPLAEAPVDFEPARRVVEEPEPEAIVSKAERPAPTFDRPSRVTFARVPSAPALIAETAAVEIQNPPPAYPLAARRRGVEGEVLVQLEITAEGACASASVAGSSGSTLLDDAATAAVREWRFRPATRDGRAIASTQKIRFVFTLKS
jgi:protein TonB